jgi:SagB-type dehydrogenase family enzyme
MALTEALAKRRSARSFQNKPLSRDQVSQLCWAAQGITDRQSGKRTAPSAHALYAMHVFIVDTDGAFEYRPEDHSLQKMTVEDAFARLRTAAGQDSVKSAPACMVLAIEPDRLKTRCGEKAEQYSLLEAGHVAQNVLLQATALGLVSVPAGGIDERKVGEALNLPPGIRPVYALPIGSPARK